MEASMMETSKLTTMGAMEATMKDQLEPIMKDQQVHNG